MRKNQDYPAAIFRLRLSYARTMSLLRSEYSDTPAGYQDEESRYADQVRIEEAEREYFFMEGGEIKTLPVPADTFVGRRGELDELQLQFRKGHRILLIYGMGGIGKTALAAAFAAVAGRISPGCEKEHIQKSYDAVLYLPAGDGLQQAIVDDSVLSVSGMSYSIKKYRSGKKYFRAKLSALARMMGREKTLLIIDDIKKVLLKELIPVLSLDCDILMTSRLTVKKFGQLPEDLVPYPISLREMTEDDSKAMALSLLPDITPEKMLEYQCVYRQFQGHTLTLKLWLTAGGNLPAAGTGRIFPDFGNNIRNDLKRLLMKLSLLPPEGVELTWAGKMCAASAEQFGELSERSLIRLTSGDAARISMHPLIAENIRKNMGPDMKKCRNLIENIARDVGNAWNLPRAEMIKRLPAVKSVLKYLRETPAWLSAELDKIYTYLWVMEDYISSERGYLKLFQAIRDHYGEDSQNTGWTALRVAAVYHNSLRFDEAERWYRSGLGILRRCAPENADYWWQRVEACGKCMRGPLFRGEKENVLELIREADDLCRQAPEEARSDRFLLTEAYHSRRSAGIYLNFGHRETAERCRQKMHLQMDRYFSNCGEDGPKILDIRETDMEFELAAGNLPAALHLLEENLADYILYRGPCHEDTLHCMEKLADVLLMLADQKKNSSPEDSAGRIKRAKQLYCHAAAGIRGNYPFEAKWLRSIEERIQKL